MCRHFDMMEIFFLHNRIWGWNWELNKVPEWNLKTKRRRAGCHYLWHWHWHEHEHKQAEDKKVQEEDGTNLSRGPQRAARSNGPRRIWPSTLRARLFPTRTLAMPMPPCGGCLVCTILSMPNACARVPLKLGQIQGKKQSDSVPEGVFSSWNILRNATVALFVVI
jgi:hypothetical protein